MLLLKYLSIIRNDFARRMSLVQLGMQLRKRTLLLLRMFRDSGTSALRSLSSSLHLPFIYHPDKMINPVPDRFDPTVPIYLTADGPVYTVYQPGKLGVFRVSLRVSSGFDPL